MNGHTFMIYAVAITLILTERVLYMVHLYIVSTIIMFRKDL